MPNLAPVFGVGVPRNTPTEIVDKLNKEVNNPKIKARIADLGGAVLVLSPAEFGKHISAELEKWVQGDPDGQHQTRMRPVPADAAVP